MKTIRIFIVLSAIFALLSCHKGEVLPLYTANIPNGDFENWGQDNTLDDWQTRYCPMCAIALNTYTVQKTTDAYHGKFAAKFTYNGVFAATASNKFAISQHPANLTAFVKYAPYGTDTVSIKIKLFNKSVAVDSGVWTGIAAIANYQGLSIPVTHHSLSADSALITIKGGTKWDAKGNGTVLWVDYLLLH
jgi:hypothetical protein